MNGFKYRPDIDGLRAVAVVLVLLFHAGFGFGGGFVGVDVFFVISGYLITGIILKQQANETFELSNLWMRRIRRIVPAATCMVFVTLILGGILMLPIDFLGLGEQAIAQQLILSNIYFWKETGYFDGPADLKPLLHTWSLAVEEQFYLIYPFLLYFCRNLSRRKLGLLLTGIAGTSFVASAVTVSTYPSATFFLLPTRAWEMLLGGLLVFVPPPVKFKAWQLNALSWVGFGAIVTSGLVYSSSIPFPGPSALIPCGGAALLIFSNSTTPTQVGRLLSKRPIVFVGLISYSLYLWHWPLLAFPKYWLGLELSPWISGTSLALSSLLAYLSWRYIETPFRTGTFALPKLQPLKWGIASTIVVTGLCGLIILGEGIPVRFPDHVMRYCNPKDMLGKKYTREAKDVVANNLPFIGVDPSGREQIDCFVWGDSHSMAIGPLCSDLAKREDLNCVIASRGGTTPLLGVWRPAKGNDSLEWTEQVMQYIEKHRIPNVILVSRWAIYVQGSPKSKEVSLIVDKDSKDVCVDESFKAFRRGLVRTLTRLEKAGARVWIMEQVPFQEGRNPSKEAIRAVLLGKPLPAGNSLEHHFARQQKVKEVFETLHFPNVTFLDPTPYAFAENKKCRLCDEDGLYYRDTNHITPLGAERLLTEMLEPTFRQISVAVHDRSKSTPPTKIASGVSVREKNSAIR